ncbi:MAG TPA: adenylate kinase [Gaiellaceae bacterium]|jgi:adenylate kinase
MNIIVLGPQGSGKGTQGKKIAQTYGIPHIATGDELRKMRELPTPTGQMIKEVMDRGELVSDDLLIRMIRDRLDRGDTVPGFVLDGFPRTLVQAEVLDDLLGDLGRSIDIVFEFQVPDRGQLIDRLTKRAAEENRTDDTPEAIQTRLAEYDEKTAPLVEYYRTSRGNVVGIHADRTVGEVFHEIEDALHAVEARA